LQQSAKSVGFQITVMSLFHRLILGTSVLLLAGPIAPVAANPSESATPSACPAPALDRIQRHTVAAGESLEAIAEQYNLIPATLIGFNPQLRGGGVQPGMELKIPPYNGITVNVNPGQTWPELASAYNVRADVLFEVNGCQPPQAVAFIPGVNWSPTSSPETGLPEAATDADATLDGYPLPEPGETLLAYGWRVTGEDSKVVFHSGIDLQADAGTPVLAVEEGIVAYASDRGTYGNLVVINHPGGKQTRYAHLQSIEISLRQKVRRGDRLGSVGTSGSPDVGEPHLHFEVRSNSDLGWVAEDPALYLRSQVSER
jgi:murein DD-endopeptidase MepM/ murein hydrolase activator NlpD